MAGYLRPRNFAIVGGIGAALFFFPRTSAQVSPGNIFETPAVKSVGDRHAAGGASNTHTTGIATTRGEGDSSSTTTSQVNPSGVDSPKFQREQAMQKVGGSGDSSPMPGAGQLHAAVYGKGNEKGK